MLLQDLLPSDVWGKIYDYDGTYRRHLVDVHREMRQVVGLLHTFIWYDESKVKRRITKAELLILASFLHIKVPKRITKPKLVFLLNSYLHFVVPGATPWPTA